MQYKPDNSIHTSPRAAALLKKRYAFERNFKWAGFSAIILSILVLLTLLYTIVEKVAGAFTENYITLDVTFDKAALDPQGAGKTNITDPSTYAKLWRTSLRAEFPYIEAGRKSIPLYALVSDAAALEVREAVQDNPSLIGQTKKFSLLTKDFADLYLKGRYGTLEKVDNVGTIKPEGTTGTVKVTFEKNSFDKIINFAKAAMERDIQSLKRQAEAQERGVISYQKQLAEAKTETEKPPLQEKLNSFVSKRDALIQQISKLEQDLRMPEADRTLTSAMPSVFVQVNEGIIKVQKIRTDHFEGQVIIPLKSSDMAQAGAWQLLVNERPENARRISDMQMIWLEQLKAKGKIEQTANWRFLTGSFSREAEQVGIWGALMGSILTMLVTLVLSLPIGVIAAIYLEEFAPKNRITDFIEVSINNLAAVPSIIFGLLGLAFIITPIMGMPPLAARSTPLAGGIVLALLILPTIIIATRAAIKAVPPSIRQAALGLGASKNQAVFHHVLPLAMPGIMTGTIIGMAHALGETAPLLMIGMKAFVVDVPTYVTDPATAMPVQIFLMSDFPEIGFQMKTAAAILVLLVFLILMNGFAIWLRHKFERKW